MIKNVIFLADLLFFNTCRLHFNAFKCWQTCHRIELTEFKLYMGHIHTLVKVKSCYNPLRLGTVIVLISSGIDFVNTPRLYSDRATHLERLPIWLYGLCQREPKVPGLYKKHTATQPRCPR